MKTKKKLSPHSLMTVNTFFKRRRRLPLSALLAFFAIIVAGFFYTAAPPTVHAIPSTTILISEVEADPIQGGLDNAFEWFEIVNISGSSQTLTGWTVTDDATSDVIPTVTLAPGQYVVVAANSANFLANHPGFTGTVVQIADGFIGNSLNNTSDVLTLQDSSTNTVDCVSWGANTSCLNPAVTAPPSNTTDTIQRKSNIDHDTNEDWFIANETPGAASGFQGIIFDQSGRGCSFFDLLSPPTLTWTQTIDGGTNRILIVGVSTYTVTPVTATRVLSVTYGGQLLTRIDDTLARSTTNQSQVEMFYLLEPGITAATSSTVQVTFNPVATTTTAYAVGGSASFLFVDQSAPFNTNQVGGNSQGVSPTFARRAGTGVAPGLTVNSNPGELVIDTIASIYTGAGTAQLTANSTQIERWNGKDAPSCFSPADSVGAGSTELATSTTVPMTWAFTGGISNPWVIGAVSLRPQAVTAVKLSSLTATESNGGVSLRWQTGFEVNNLGFNVYREQRGKRTRLNPAIIAGSALLAGQGTRLTAGQSYSWADRSVEAGEPVQYWLEDIDLDGTRTLHGPVAPVVSANAQVLSDKQAVQLSQLNELQADKHGFTNSYPLTQHQRTEESSPIKQSQQQSQASPAELLQRRNLASKFLRINGELLYLILSEFPPLDERVGINTTAAPPADRRLSYAPEDPLTRQQTLAASAAVKIAIRQTGWYRVTQAELVAAGVNPNIDPSLLHLYADGVEQPILLNGSKKQFGADSSIEFYGTGMDTPTSDQRTYWLVVGSQPGRRVGQGNVLSNWLEQDISVIVPSTTESAPTPPPTVNPATPAKPAETVPAPVVKPEVQVRPWLILNNPSTARVSDTGAKKKKTRKKKAAQKILRERSHALVNRKSAQSVQELSSSQGFAYVSERKERINYFSGLLNGDAENFFGPLVLSGSQTRQDLNVNNIDNSTSAQASLEIALQGLTAQAHQVRVSLNGTEVGVVSFADLEHPVARFSIPHSSLVAGNNAIMLVSQSGEADISLVDYVRLTYLHTYRAETDALVFTSQRTTPLTVDGFTSPQIRVFDVTDTEAVAPVNTKVSKQGSSYSVKVAGGNGTTRTLLAVAESQIQHPAEIKANEPSAWARNSNRADFLILTHRDFREAVKPLADLRRSQGMEVAVVDVEDIYDEFSYGAKSPQAVKDFLSWAKGHWQLAPRYALLVGDSSLDPRNYLGFGNQDFVPTKLVDATVLETASDDALADSDGDGLADMALGRLPVKTAEQAQKVIGKIVNYAPGQPAYSALLVSDRKEGYDFEASNNQVRALLPQDLSITMVNRRENSAEQVRSEVIGGINAGPLLVNYAGHGSSDIWTGAGILNSTDAAALSNGNRLPLFVIMTCLNGRFHDPFRETLSEALMRADQGGAIAVWASSGLTEPDAQSAMDQQLMRLLFAGGGQSPTLGDAVRGAKAATTNVDVRRTWILFGDPTMRIR
jgi:hypothetical protein